MPSEVVAGLRFHTQRLGTAGPPIVLVHGLMIGTLANWYFTAAPLLARRCRVFMYDLRGHGLSERADEGFDFRSMAADLAALAEHFVQEEQVTVVGHSYGGGIALRFALDYPDRVARLVIVDTPLPVTTATTVELMFRDAGMALPDGGAAAITPELVTAHLGRTLDTMLGELPADQEAALRGSGRLERRMGKRIASLAVYSAMVEELTRSPDIADSDLARCRCPVLLCYGTRTPPAVTQTLHRLAAALPDAQVRMFDAGHFVPREQPRALAEAIEAFCDG